MLELIFLLCCLGFSLSLFIGPEIQAYLAEKTSPAFATRLRALLFVLSATGCAWILWAGKL